MLMGWWAYASHVHDCFFDPGPVSSSTPIRLMKIPSRLIPKHLEYYFASILCLVGFVIFLGEYQEHLDIHERFPVWILVVTPLMAVTFYFLYRRAKKKLLLLLPFLAGGTATANGVLLAGLALALLAAALALGINDVLNRLRRIEDERQHQMTNDLPEIGMLSIPRTIFHYEPAVAAAAPLPNWETSTNLIDWESCLEVFYDPNELKRFFRPTNAPR